MSKLIVLTGGGTGGPVTPLLAVADDLRARGYEMAWVGTKTGIERSMVEGKRISFYPISAGKLRRYASWQNITDLFRIKLGFFQALILLRKLKPALIMTAGGFVSVPVVWAGWLLGIPALVHQQDIRPGLANRLMAPFAKIVTVTFEKNINDYGKKAVWTGNALQPEFQQLQSRGQQGNLPRLLVLGGGTGAESINRIISVTLNELITFCSVTHVTGKTSSVIQAGKPGYAAYNFLNPQAMAKEMADADAVVSRAGMGTLTELAYLGKPVLIIPMPDSHQEDNAAYFGDCRAALVVSQKALTPEIFVSALRNLLKDENKRGQLSQAIKRSMKLPGNQAIIAAAERILA